MEYKVKRRPRPAVACQYEIGREMEDGLATLTEVVTNAHIFSDNIVQIDTPQGVMCPYINNLRGRTFINKGDWVIFEEDGSKHIVSNGNLWNRYEKIEE